MTVFIVIVLDTMSRFRNMLAVTLALLFLALSFNAYACLVPIFGASQAMAKGCSDAGDKSPRVFCDGFKMLGPQSSEKAPPLEFVQFGDAPGARINLILPEPSSFKTLVNGSPPALVSQFPILRI